MRKNGLYFLTISLLFLVHSQVQAYSFSLVTSKGGTLYLESSATDQQETRYLIDTGSSLTILNEETFNALKSEQSVEPNGLIIAKLANGSKQKVKLYTLPLLKLSEDCQFENVSVVVMKNQHNILGMEVLSRAAPIGIQMAPPQLTLTKCDISAIPDLASNHNAANH